MDIGVTLFALLLWVLFVLFGVGIVAEGVAAVWAGHVVIGLGVTLIGVLFVGPGLLVGFAVGRAILFQDDEG